MLDVLAQTVTPHGGPSFGVDLASRDVRTVAGTMVAAAAYGTWGYFKNRQKRGESFDIERLAATFIVALGVSVLNLVTGNQLTANSVMGQLGIYASQVYFVEKSIESVVPDTLPGASDKREP